MNNVYTLVIPLLCKEGQGEVEVPKCHRASKPLIAIMMPSSSRLYTTLILPLQRGGNTRGPFCHKAVTTLLSRWRIF